MQPTTTPQPCECCLTAPAEVRMACSERVPLRLLSDAQYILRRSGFDAGQPFKPGLSLGAFCRDCGDDMLTEVADLAPDDDHYPLEAFDLDPAETECAVCRRLFPTDGNNACESCASEFEDDQDDDDEESEEL